MRRLRNCDSAVKRMTRLLAVVDPTAISQPAVRRAADIAALFGAKLDLLICYHDEYLSGDRLVDAPSLQSARDNAMAAQEQKLEKLATPLREQGLDVVTTALWRHPLFEGISWHAAQSAADMVFKDTHHHDVLKRTFFSNSDWELIRNCPAPLWLVKSADPLAGSLLAAIDPLHEHDKPAALDDRILTMSKSLAEMLDLPLHVFHSYDPRTAEATVIGNAYIPPTLPYLEIEDAIRSQHEKRFSEMTSYHEIDEKHCHLVPGLAHRQLPELARSLPAGLIIMGAVARNRLKRLFIGATAERTLEHLPCDLLVIKPDSFHSP